MEFVAKSHGKKVAFLVVYTERETCRVCPVSKVVQKIN